MEVFFGFTTIFSFGGSGKIRVLFIMNEKREVKKCPFFKERRGKKKGESVACPCLRDDWDQHVPDCWDNVQENKKCLGYRGKKEEK